MFNGMLGGSESDRFVEQSTPSPRNDNSKELQAQVDLHA
jgi:hypothetical protein